MYLQPIDVEEISKIYTSRYIASGLLPNNTIVDWRLKGAVSSVKHQGSCKSCWAFSLAGALEGMHKLRKGVLYNLSAQQLVDCDMLNNACDGGWPYKAMTYVARNGMETEESYPYLDRPYFCRYNKTKVVVTSGKWWDIKKGSETDFTHAIGKIGPITAVVNIKADFVSYKSGVYYGGTCRPELGQHAVLVVGYGVTDTGTEYYIVKNSWGVKWGENGYIRMSRNRGNNCDIATYAGFPSIN